MYGSRCSARLRALYTLATKSISIHHSQSSQSISIFDREIGAKISVSLSISRFLRLDNVLYRCYNLYTFIFEKTGKKSRGPLETPGLPTPDLFPLNHHSSFIVISLCRSREALSSSDTDRTQPAASPTCRVPPWRRRRSPGEGEG